LTKLTGALTGTLTRTPRGATLFVGTDSVPPSILRREIWIGRQREKEKKK
jgi:hypothetical protein